ncbi:Biotin/lipoate A/B protein ligase [Mortierella polycephala]|uniref:Putative lipoate-protein ligase A n=1 Tax=Mortierella polycephala TaxID=41804 RepID=A0A9P6U058_9FUNG|nr:Biotin/lipoate A/B protein ligase [Mortierella polycephala]
MLHHRTLLFSWLAYHPIRAGPRYVPAAPPAAFSALVSGTRHLLNRRHYSTSESATGAQTGGTNANENSPSLRTKNVKGNYKVETYISKINDPWTNLAFEEWLFRNSDPSTYILFLYRNSKSVIIGRNQNPWKECNLKLLAKDGVPFVRRKSGGGTVYHVSSRIKSKKDVSKKLKPQGSAFKLIQQRAYHHGTMLIDTDLSTLGQYLKVDRSSLVTKGVASVRSPVTRLRESSFTIDHLSFCEAVRTEFLKRYSIDQWRQNLEGEPVVVDEALVDSIDGVKKIRDEMKTWGWMYGQTPEFTYRLEKTFPWGSVNVSISSKLGMITHVEMDCLDNATNVQSLPLIALGIGMEGQRYDQQGLDLAIERIMDEAPEVLSPAGVAEKVKDVVHWLKEEL